jgi:hypothetical protein
MTRVSVTLDLMLHHDLVQESHSPNDTKVNIKYTRNHVLIGNLDIW